MTSFAFIFGVLPLALASGAGANSRVAIGTAVIGGMLAATLLAIFYIPLLFVIVRSGFREWTAGAAQPVPAAKHGGGMRRAAALLAATLALEACSLAPDYVRPAPPVAGVAGRSATPISRRARQRCRSCPTARSSAILACRR